MEEAMTLFWFGIGAGVAGVTLIVWTMMRAGKAADDWLALYGPLEAPHVRRVERRPFNQNDDGDWWIKLLREEIASLPETAER